MLIKMINQIFGIVEIEFILIAKRYVIALIGFNAAQENNAINRTPCSMLLLFSLNINDLI